ncbi:Bifunctional enzyme IspD/IspF [Dirofilaria immitis]
MFRNIILADQLSLFSFQEKFADSQDMETAFEKLMMADGTLSIGHVDQSIITQLPVISPLRDKRHRLKNSIHNSPEKNLSDFVLEDNYLEDSWGLNSSMLSGTFSYPENQRVVSMSVQRDSRIYRFCWVSDSELDSISVQGDFSLNRLTYVMDSVGCGLENCPEKGKEDTSSNCSKIGVSSNFDRTSLSMSKTSFTTSFSESEEEIY